MIKISLKFGRAEHLIGVLHESETVVPSKWGILLWNTGISNRTGPFRLNVDIADRLCKKGHTVLRFDLSRLGDSTDAGETCTVQERSNRDLADAVQLLADRYQLTDFLLVGVCSSAVDAYYYAQQDSRIKALIMVDGFVYPTLAHRWRYLLHRLGDLRRWTHFVRRHLPWVKDQHTVSLDYFEANYPEITAARTGVEHLLARGTSMLVVYTGGFHAHFSHPSQFTSMLQSPGFQGDIEVHHWPKADHLFSILEDRECFLALVESWSTRVVASHAGAAQPLGLPAAEDLSSTTPAKPRSKVEYFSPEQSPILALAQAEATDQQLARFQAKALEVFQKVLYPADFTDADSFFEFGGTSVLAIKAAAILSEDLGLSVSVLWIYEAPRAADLGLKLYQSSLEAGSNSQGAEEPSAQPTTTAHPVDQQDPIAIIGIACHVPGAKNWQEFWQNVCEGRETITHFSLDELDPSIPFHQRTHPNYVAARGIIEGDRFDHQFFGISKREAAFADPQQRVLLETCWQALEDAGYSKQRSQLPIATYVGTSNTSYMNRNLMMGHVTPHSEEEFLANLYNDKETVATRIAYTLDLRGPAVSVHTACSTSLVAVIEAIKALRCGDAAIALAGGASVESPLASGHLYQEGGIFSQDGHCRPFAADASGTMFSDGSAVVVLRPLSAALEAGDHIYAVIRGWGINNDGADKTSFAAPSIRGQSQAICEAYRKASWSPGSLGYLEAHGTGTPIGDPIEVEALRRAFYQVDPTLKSRAPFCAIGSTKSLIGHLTAAAGTIGLIKAALAIAQKKIPPQPLQGPLNPELRLAESPFYLPPQLEYWNQAERRAGVSSFGIGGTNAHVLLEQAPDRAPVQAIPPAEALDPWIVLPWSAADRTTCERLGEQIIAQMPQEQTVLGDYAASLRETRAALSWRQTLVGWDADSLGTLSKPSPQPIEWQHERSQPRTPLVWLFPGQGSQYPHMGRTLASHWPRFDLHYRHCLGLFADAGLPQLLQLIFNSEDQQLIHETLYTQPAIFSFQWALGQSLLALDVPVAAALGHSIGEYAAACLAGVFTVEEAVPIVLARAQAMEASPQGAMLAIRAAWDDVSALLPADLSLAAINSPKAIVVAGPEAAIQKAAELCKQKSMACRRLETSRAFHSPMMDPILPRFAEAFKHVRLRPARWNLISSVDGLPLLGDRLTSADYWVRQLREPVRFADAVSNLEAQSPFYLELGPRDILTRLLPALTGHQGRGVSLGRSAELSAEPLHVASAMAELWSRGFVWHTTPLRRRVPVPVYPFYGEKHWLAPQPVKQEPAPRPEAAPMPVLQSQTYKVGPAHSQQRLLVLLKELSGLNDHDVSLDKTWNALGLDSLLLTQWALKLQKEWNLDINLSLLQSELGSLGQLARFIDAKVTPEQDVLHPEDSSRLSTGDEPSSWPSLAQVFQQQIQIMQQQLDLLARYNHIPQSLTQAAPVPPAAYPINLGQETMRTIYTDEGALEVPQWAGSVLVRNEAGQAALWVEDAEQRGMFYEPQSRT